MYPKGSIQAKENAKQITGLDSREVDHVSLRREKTERRRNECLIEQSTHGLSWFFYFAFQTSLVGLLSESHHEEGELIGFGMRFVGTVSVAFAIVVLIWFVQYLDRDSHFRERIEDFFDYIRLNSVEREQRKEEANAVREKLMQNDGFSSTRWLNKFEWSTYQSLFWQHFVLPAIILPVVAYLFVALLISLLCFSGQSGVAACFPSMWRL